MYGDGGVEPDPYRGHEFPEIRNVPADTHPHDSVRLSSLLGGVAQCLHRCFAVFGEGHSTPTSASSLLKTPARALLSHLNLMNFANRAFKCGE